MSRGSHCLAAFLLVLVPELIRALSVESPEGSGVPSHHLRSVEEPFRRVEYEVAVDGAVHALGSKSGDGYDYYNVDGDGTDALGSKSGDGYDYYYADGDSTDALGSKSGDSYDYYADGDSTDALGSKSGDSYGDSYDYYDEVLGDTTDKPGKSGKSDVAKRYPFDMMPCENKTALVTESMTKADYETISESVQKQLRGLSDTCDTAQCQQADWAGCVLRLAGHDFMDFRGPGSGSDGCIDFEDEDNKGLKPCLSEGEHGQKLSDSYAKVCSRISLADFIVIAAEAVMTETRKRATGTAVVDFKSAFRFGRKTSKTCPDSVGKLPNPEKGCPATEDVFVKAMKLDWKEAAGLMGVHTLGRAQSQNSGYDGWWSDPEHSRTFNNNYYVAMLSKSWKPVKSSENKFQWDRQDVGANKTGRKHEMMLNTDLCLAFNLKDHSAEKSVTAKDCECLWLRSTGFKAIVDANGLTNDWCGNKTGGFGVEHKNCCPQRNSGCDDLENPTGVAIEAVREFAEDDSKWIATFMPAWKKATENGFTTLQALA